MVLDLHVTLGYLAAYSLLSCLYIVHMLPQVYICRGPEGTHLFSTGIVQIMNHRIKRAIPIFIPALIRLGIIGSTAFKTATLIKGDH